MHENKVNPVGDALGGDVALAVAARVDAPLPLPVLGPLGCRAQAFANAGTLLPYRFARSLSRSYSDILGTFRASAGIGIAAKTPVGRLECNYTLWSRAQDSD